MKTLSLIILPISLLVAFGCIASNDQSVIPGIAQESPPLINNITSNSIQPVELPKDSLHHNTPIEWWYFNGHLTDSEGNQFSYHFTVFQTEQDLDGSYPQLFHLSWHDHQTRNVYHSEKTFQQYGELPKDYINFRVAAWQMTETEEQFILYFDIPDSTIELYLNKTKQPILHDGTGFVDMKEAGQTYYYTYSSLQASGKITSANKQVAISGTSWMDHQWGDFLDNQSIGWDWFSLHLDNNQELMIAYVRNSDTQNYITSYGTFIDEAGNSTHLDPEDFILESSEYWFSKASSSKYPIKWNLHVTDLDLKLEITAVTPDSEFFPESQSVTPYWEGSTLINGSYDDLPVSGYGFMELVGY